MISFKEIKKTDQHFYHEYNIELKSSRSVLAAYENNDLKGCIVVDHNNETKTCLISDLYIVDEYKEMDLEKKLFYISSILALKEGMNCICLDMTNRQLENQFYLDSKEYHLSYSKVLFGLVALEFSKYPYVTAQVITKTANTTFRYLPKSDDVFVEVVKDFIQNKVYGYFSVATLWVKKRQSVINMKYLPFFEEIVLHDLKSWAEVDQFCYRIMNPLIELEPSNYSYLDKWSSNSSKDVRRVALVSMIRTCKGGLKLYYDYNHMITLVDRLKHDSDIHVRKAVGWVLKCAYPTYPIKVEQYLRDNVANLDRLIFRYALEHVDNEKKKELMSLGR